MNDPSPDDIPISIIRPRFKVEIQDSSEDLAERIKLGLKKSDAPCQGKVIKGHALLYLPESERHYWSPQLTLAFPDNEDTLRGLYGPRPAVWTMFIFFYAVLGFATIVISMVGLSYLSLDKPAGILWFVPLLIIAFFTLYAVAYSGKKRGKEQMSILHDFVEEATGLVIRENN